MTLAKKSKGIQLVTLFRLMKPQQGRYLFFTVFSTMLGALGRTMSGFALGLVASAVESGRWERILWVAALLVVQTLLSMADSLLRKRVSLCVDGMMARIRRDTFTKAQRLPMAYYDTTLSGDIMSRVTNDITVFDRLFRELIPLIFFFLWWGIFSIGFTVLVNWWLGLIFVAASILFKKLNDFFVKRVRKHSDEAYALNAELMQELLSVLSGNVVIKLFGLQAFMLARYKRLNARQVEAGKKQRLFISLQDLTNSLMTSTVSYVALVAAALLVLSGQMQLPVMLVVYQLSWSVTMVFRWTGQFLGDAVAQSVAGGRIQHLLETPDEPQAIALPCAENTDSEIAFEQVRFGYSEDSPVIQDISFAVEKGKTLALVGESGGGKSTVIKLLLALYDPDCGNIWVGGRPLCGYTRDELRSVSAYVSQESFLFDTSIRENIRLGRPDATDTEVEQAARMANAHEFIREQPEGYDTIVGERATKLSGGQKQRLAIARALLKDAPILLLDEATSALDAENQEAVQRALDTLMSGKTTIVVAHRLSTVENADEILVINAGRVAERGTHEQLLQKRGAYYKLHSSQFAHKQAL